MQSTAIALGGVPVSMFETVTLGEVFRTLGWPGIVLVLVVWSAREFVLILGKAWDRYDSLQEKRVLESVANRDALNRSTDALNDLKQLIEHAIHTVKETAK